MSGAMNRRQAALTFGAVWGALLAPSSVLAQVTMPSWAPRALTAVQARTLDTVAELIIPGTDTPGAREAGVPQFVDRAIADYCTPTDAAAIRDGLDRIEADSQAAHGAPFPALSPQAQVALLERYEGEGRSPRPAPAAPGRGDTETGLSNQPRPAAAPPRGKPFFPLLKELVTVGYFTSEAGATKAVRYDPVPGAYRGCVPLKEIGRAWAL